MSSESIVGAPPLYERRRRQRDRQSEMQRRQLHSHSQAEGEGGEDRLHDAIQLSAIGSGVVLARCSGSRERGSGHAAELLLLLSSQRRRRGDS